MTRTRTRLALVAGALSLGLAGAFLGTRAASAPALVEPTVSRVDAFTVAGLLAGNSPEVVVITLDATARHPLRGAMPAGAFGEGDEAFVERAPRARRMILAGTDPVRVDRVARRLLATRHEVAVLEGGIEAWDRAMDADPAPPSPSAAPSAWPAHRMQVALRRSFGDAAAAPATPVIAPVAPAVAAPGGPKKREGC